jgi:predicted ArsR family transcriptional regulator
MSNTREKVLKTLLVRRRCTINDLAEAVGINPISVRHHINKLEAENLVTSEEERHGVGRPRYVYSLTDKGLEQFPTRYVSLTIRLIEQLKETLPEPMLEKLFTQMAHDMATDYAEDLKLEELSIEERLDVVRDILEAEGFTMNWKLEDGYYQIEEVSCPFHRVGETHPEICSVGETLISNVLAKPLEKSKCILEGDSYCTYRIPAPEEAKSEG